jgi:hypothetical protein
MGAIEHITDNKERHQQMTESAQATKAGGPQYVPLPGPYKAFCARDLVEHLSNSLGYLSASLRMMGEGCDSSQYIACHVPGTALTLAEQVETLKAKADCALDLMVQDRRR